MQSAPHTVPPKPAHPDGRPRLRVVRDASVDVLSYLRPRQPADASFVQLRDAYRAHERATRGAWRLWAETTALRTWHRALVELGIPHPATGPRRLHATRHTFVSQALRADAQERALEPVTHTAGAERDRSRAFGLYAHLDWSDSCRAVAKLQDALAGA